MALREKEGGRDRRLGPFERSALMRISEQLVSKG